MPAAPTTTAAKERRRPDAGSLLVGEAELELPKTEPLTAQPARSWVSVLVLCALVSIICSIDRTAMSVAILPMSREFGWNDSAKGAVSSAFNVGHMLTNLYGGYLAASMSPKRVLSVGVIVWSLFTMLTPPAAELRWLPALLLVRAVMGLGEGVAFPTMQAIVKGWVPPDSRSRALSLIYSGHQIGSILSLLCSPLLIASTGVDAMFYMYGLLGFVWLALWDPLVSPQPLQPGTKPPAPVRLRDLPWRQMAGSKSFWAILVAHSTFGILYNTGIAWLPTYYNQEFNLDVRRSSFLSILPWLVMALGTNASGWAADALINRRLLSTTHTRKLLQVIGSIGPGVCLLWLAASGGSKRDSEAQQQGTTEGTAPAETSLAGAVSLLTLTMGLLGLQAGGFASNHQDISTQYASVLFGITNACASMAGSVTVYLVGVVLDATGQDWALVFQGVAATCFASALLYATCASSEPQFD